MAASGWSSRRKVLFDGTPVSWNQILWRYNQETFNVAPIEWFFNEFYYPGLLADIFAGKRPRVAQDVSKKDRRQPVVKLSLVGTSSGIVRCHAHDQSEDRRRRTRPRTKTIRKAQARRTCACFAMDRS